jgi:hypothetical protein
MPLSAQAASSVLSGRYVVFGEIASGGMASVLYGRLLGPVGFARPVAIKRLHPHIAREPGLVSMFIDEARICSRVSHANVVPTLDVIEAPGELSLVMEYVHGVSLEMLLELAAATGQRVPLGIAASLLLGTLHGLSAAHEACTEAGELLGIVHRDVSPQNILVGVDGVPRLLDFGIAKARGRLRSTPSGEIKGKLLYMAPEQFKSGDVDLRVDVYSASAVLWEVLCGRTLFGGASESAIIHSVLHDEVRPPSQLRDDVSPALDAIVLRGVARDPDQRYGTARALIAALERELRAASQSEVSAWLHDLAGDALRARAEWLQELQRTAEKRPVALLPAPLHDRREPIAVTRIAPDPNANAWEGGRPSFTEVRPRARRLAGWVVGTLVLLLAVGLWQWLSSRATRAHKAPDAQGAAPRVPQPPQPALPTSSIDASTGSGSAEDWQTAEPSATEPARPAPAPMKEESKLQPHAKPSAKQREAPKQKPALDCREPFVIDALGVKRWKRECL